MANVKMYSKKDKRVVNFPITCTPSDDECEKCPLKFNCNKAQIKEEDRNQGWQQSAVAISCTYAIDGLHNGKVGYAM